MKIVIAAEIFPPDIGGPATYSPKIATALVQAGHEVKLVCYSDKKQKDSYSFEIFRIKRSKFKLHYVNYYRQLKKLARDCDVIYAQGPVGSGWPAVKVAKKLGKKLVVKVVGDYAWEQARNSGVTEIGIDEFQNPEQKFSGKIGTLQKIERQVCQQAKKVIVPSQYLKRIVAGWGVEEGKIEVVYNALNFLKKEFHEVKNSFSIISAARLVSWKGFDILIEVVDELSKEKKDIFLDILGEGPLHLVFTNKIKKLKNEKIKLISSLPHDIFLQKLQMADLFVLNTAYEGLSHVILEAMAAGVPVVTTNVGGNPELITDGENGLLVEFNNKEQLKEAILKLYNNPELGKKFADNSKEVLKKFTSETMISKTIKILESV